MSIYTSNYFKPTDPVITTPPVYIWRAPSSPSPNFLSHPPTVKIKAKKNITKKEICFLKHQLRYKHIPIEDY